MKFFIQPFSLLFRLQSGSFQLLKYICTHSTLCTGNLAIPDQVRVSKLFAVRNVTEILLKTAKELTNKKQMYTAHKCVEKKGNILISYKGVVFLAKLWTCARCKWVAIGQRACGYCLKGDIVLKPWNRNYKSFHVLLTLCSKCVNLQSNQWCLIDNRVWAYICFTCGWQFLTNKKTISLHHVSTIATMHKWHIISVLCTSVLWGLKKRNIDANGFYPK